MKALLTANKLKFVILAFVLSLPQAKAFFSEPILIQSLESRTIRDEPVFNEITWFSYPDKDVWMMNQSHYGLNAKANQKDRLAIVIDKSKMPKTAYFMQLTPGPLVWSEDLYSKKVAFSVSCFMCHSNGLRTIRADPYGEVKLDLLSQARLNYFNYKIRSYGLLVENEKHEVEDVSLKVPFRYLEKFDNQVLKVESCRYCHDGKIRGELKRQNAVSILFQVQNNLMPPDKKLSEKELRKIRNFTNGL